MNPKTSLLACIALGATAVFAAGPVAASQHRHPHNVNGGNAHDHNHNPLHRPNHNHKQRGGPNGKAAYCAARTASISSVSAASTASIASVSTKSVASVASVSKVSTHSVATHTTAAPKSTPKDDDNDSGSGGGGAWTGTYTGEVTLYEIGTNSCGGFDTEPDMICALAIPRAQSYPGFTGNNNKNPICGQWLTLHWKGGSVRCKVTDTCERCAWDDVDLSHAAFSKLTGGQLGLGRIYGVEWTMD